MEWPLVLVLHNWIFWNGGRLHFNGDTYYLLHPPPPLHTHTCIYACTEICAHTCTHACMRAHRKIKTSARLFLCSLTSSGLAEDFMSIFIQKGNMRFYSGFSDAFQRVLNSTFCMIQMGFYVCVCIRWHFFSCEISSEFVQKSVCLGKFWMLIFTILT